MSNSKGQPPNANPTKYDNSCHTHEDNLDVNCDPDDNRESNQCPHLFLGLQ